MKRIPSIAACAALISVFCATSPAHAAWTQFRAKGTNNAVVRGELKVRWETETDGRISSSPSFAHGVVFVGTNAGTLYAIRVRDGLVLWKHHVANALMSAPLLYRGMVITGEGNADTPHPKGGAPVHVGTGESALIAFDQKTGAIRWVSYLRGSGMPTPAIVDNVLVHHDGSGRITGMDPMTGRVLYERNLHSVASMSSALPVGDKSFVTSGVLFNAVWKVQARTGRVQWRSAAFPENASGIGDCPLASDGTRVLGDYMVPDGASAREHAYALDAHTGALLWDTPLETGPLPVNNEAGIPVLHDGVLYVGNAGAPWVNALDAKTGRILWRKQINGPVKGGFVVKRRVLYFGDLGGYLWALNARSGAQMGVKSMPTSFNVGSAIAVGKTLIIGSFTGSIYAVPLQDIRDARDDGDRG